MDLVFAITDLNFREPIKFETHPFLPEISEWKSRKPSPLMARGTFEEVDNPVAFQLMIDVLKEAEYWAIDVEHCNNSYSGITCLIQISTEFNNFVVDPFPLNRQIKTLLKPLLESGAYVKVMHGCFNDLRWLQRDFNIFVWPVIDTQIIYRDIKKHQKCERVEGVPNISNISLARLITQYFPDHIQKDDYACGDFRQRPLPAHLKVYAMDDAAVLLPLLCKMNNEFKTSTSGTFNIHEFYQKCAVHVAKKALYQGKVYPSAIDVMKKYKTKCDFVLFNELFNWRDDLARALDHTPETILNTPNLMRLSTMSSPCSLVQIKRLTKFGSEWCVLKNGDLRTVERIIDERKYNKFKKCSQCGYYKYGLSEPGRTVGTSHNSIYLSPLKGITHSSSFASTAYISKFL